MNTNRNAWYRVPEVWLILFLLGSAIAGSLALVATAVRHGDALRMPAPQNDRHRRHEAHQAELPDKHGAAGAAFGEDVPGGVAKRARQHEQHRGERHAWPLDSAP